MRAEEIGLHKNPFSDLPDPRFTYRHNSFQAVCADLLYARLSERPGLTLITGAEGAGKTTLLEVLMSERTSADRYHSISGHRRLTFEAVLEQTAKAFGLTDAETDIATAFGDNMKAVAAFLLQPNREGGKVILMIDRAETLSEEVLRKLAELSRLAKGEGKLLQIVLAVTLTRGQLPPVFRAVRDAIAFESQLEPLGPEEVAFYIQHRLGVAGLEGNLPFSAEAIAEVSRFSWGLPATPRRCWM